MRPYGVLLGFILLDQAIKALMRIFFAGLVHQNVQLGLSLGTSGFAYALAVILTLMLAVFFVRARTKYWWLILLLAGATSNLLDRLLWGQVLDWLPYPGGIYGNLADIFIIAGCAGWLLNSRKGFTLM